MGAKKMWYGRKHEFVKPAGSFAAKENFLQSYIHTRIYLSTYLCPGLYKSKKIEGEDPLIHKKSTLRHHQETYLES